MSEVKHKIRISTPASKTHGEVDRNFRNKIVPPNAYIAYLNGGNTIPQKRLGINVALLNWLADSTDYSKAFADVGASHLSDDQKKQSAKAMIILHKLAGVRIPGILAEQQELSPLELVNVIDLSFAESEWTKAVGALYKSFLQLMTGETIEVEEISQLLNKENYLLIKDWLDDERNQPTLLDAFAMARNAWLMLSDKYEALVYLHRISVFEDSKKKKYYHDRRERHEATISKFNLKTTIDDGKLFTEETGSAIKNVLKQELGSLSDIISPDWIVWGI